LRLRAGHRLGIGIFECVVVTAKNFYACLVCVVFYPHPVQRLSFHHRHQAHHQAVVPLHLRASLFVRDFFTAGAKPALIDQPQFFFQNIDQRLLNFDFGVF